MRLTATVIKGSGVRKDWTSVNRNILRVRQVLPAPNKPDAPGIFTFTKTARKKKPAFPLSASKAFTD